MWSPRRSSRQSDPEAALRSYRSEPSEEFVKSLAERVAGEPPARQRTAWSRLAFAGAASTMILGVFASFGGLGYAAAGASSTYSAVKEVVVDHKVSVDVSGKSSASDQYGAPPTAPAPPENNAAPQSEVAGATGAVSAADTLPFTGLSLVATFLVGLLLLATGLILRRRERRES
jgi:hypothetical protein